MSRDDGTVDEPPVEVRGRLLSRLAATLAALPGDRPQTWRLGEALRRLFGADGAVITIGYLADARTTVCTTDDVAAGLEDLQEVLGEGPGHDAAHSDRFVVADLDGADDERWPMLTHAVDERFGPLRIHAIPLHVDGALSGVATFYTRLGADLAQPREHTIFLANAAGAALVADAHEHHDSHGAAASGSWSSRAVVHQATGMVMAQLGIPPDDALALLRGQAYALATDVGDIAARVVAHDINFSNFEVEGD